MDSQSLTQLSQPSAEAQMQILEIVLEIITLSTMVLLAISVVIIIRLCLRESRQARPGSPYAEVVKEESAGLPLSIAPHAVNSRIQSNGITFLPWYSNWARRVFSRPQS